MHCKAILLILLTRIKYMPRSILGNEVDKIAIQDADDYFSEQCIFKDRTDAGKIASADVRLNVSIICSNINNVGYCQAPLLQFLR